MRLLDQVLVLVVLVAVLAGGLCLLDDHAGVDLCFVLLALAVATCALDPLMFSGRVLLLATAPVALIPHRPPPPADLIILSLSP